MDTRMEKLANIEPGDSNEVCLAKTSLAIARLWDAPVQLERTNDLNDMIHEAEVYAGEVLNARD